MYHNVKEEVFDGILTAALEEYIDREEKSYPSDEEISAMYPITKRGMRKYKHIAKAKKYNIPIAFVYLRRAVAVFLVVVAISFGLLITSPDVRAAIKDTVVEWYEKYIQIDFGKSTDTDDTSEITDYKSLNICYIPDGFELMSSNEESNLKEYMYVAENGDYLMIGIYTSDTANVSADIEQMEYEKLTINKNDAYLVYDQIDHSGVITTGNSNYTICITAVIDKSELIKVAENIK